MNSASAVVFIVCVHPAPSTLRLLCFLVPPGVRGSLNGPGLIRFRAFFSRCNPPANICILTAFTVLGYSLLELYLAS